MIQSATQEVPVALSGMSVHGYRLGCGARIAVAMDPALIDLQGNIITSQVSWDFGGQKLIAGQAIYNANVITAATWAATAGGQSTYTTTSAHGIGVGEYVTFSGITPAAYNGTFLTLAAPRARPLSQPIRSRRRPAPAQCSARSSLAAASFRSKCST